MICKSRSILKDPSAFSFLFVLIVFLFPLFVKHEGAARAQFLDSISAAFDKKPKLTAGFATKNTFIGGFRSPIFTARAGLDFNNLVRVGAGLSWLQLGPYDVSIDNTPFYLDKSFTDSSGPHTVHPKLQFRYINLFLDYVYYRSGRWQFSIPIQVGVGDSRYVHNFNGENIIEHKKIIFLYEPAVSGQYKVLKWFGLGLDVGYRIMLVSNKQIGTRFNSPVYDIKALIFWGELYNLAFKKGS